MSDPTVALTPDAAVEAMIDAFEAGFKVARRVRDPVNLCVRDRVLYAGRKGDPSPRNEVPPVDRFRRASVVNARIGIVRFDRARRRWVPHSEILITPEGK